MRNKAFVATVALCLGLLSARAGGQAICHAENDGPAFDDKVSMGGPNELIGFKFVAPATFDCTRIEIFTGERTGLNSVGIWSHDAVNNQPGTDLGSNTWSMSSANSWQGANLTAAVQLAMGTTYWVVWGCQNASQASVDALTTGLGQVYRASFNGGATWNGPWQDSLHWKFRLYCNPCPGFWQQYGTGCLNSLGKTASLDGTLCPTPNGNVTIEIDDAIGGAFAMIFIGAGTGTAWVTSDCLIENLPLYPPVIPFFFPASGDLSIATVIPATVPTPIDVYIQTLYTDPGLPGLVSTTNPLQVHIN